MTRSGDTLRIFAVTICIAFLFSLCGNANAQPTGVWKIKYQTDSNSSYEVYMKLAPLYVQLAKVNEPGDCDVHPKVSVDWNSDSTEVVREYEGNWKLTRLGENKLKVSFPAIRPDSTGTRVERIYKKARIPLKTRCQNNNTI